MRSLLFKKLVKQCSSLVKEQNKSIKIIEKDLYKPEDTITHTGQKWNKNDYRMVRYELNGPKQVVNNWAEDLINEVSPEIVQKRVVYCDGGDGPLGHPKIFINLDKNENGICGYCGLRFYNEAHIQH